MEELLKQIEEHNNNPDYEDERVDVNEVMKRLEEAVESIIESIFDIDRIHDRIDRCYDNGDLFHYENGLEGEIDNTEWCYEVLNRAKQRANKILYYGDTVN